MIADLEKLARRIDHSGQLKNTVCWNVLDNVAHHDQHYPIYKFTVGTTAPTAPVLFITGGIHGLERIGSQLAWSLLKTTLDRLNWDQTLSELFQHIRLVVVPLVNPVGYFTGTRCNGNGVDLMRNSPIEATDKTPWLLGGQKLSNKIPWFRGQADHMEQENQILEKLFWSEAGQSSALISVDFHSGFGLRDRIWFPFSYTQTPFDDLAEMAALTHLLEETYPYHIYQIEPQSKGYLLSGDIWDYFYLNFKKKNPQSVFLPLTLEMGSWSWVRKNPAQIFSRHGAFNPMKEHRLKRTYRRHHLLFDFLLRALRSNQTWSKFDSHMKLKFESLGLQRWYQN